MRAAAAFSLASRALHTALAVFRSDYGRLIARAEKADRSGLYEVEILGFAILQRGVVYE